MELYESPLLRVGGQAEYRLWHNSRQAKFLSFGNRPKLVEERAVSATWGKLLLQGPAANMLSKCIDLREITGRSVNTAAWRTEDTQSDARKVENEVCKLGKKYPTWRTWNRLEAGFVNDAALPEWLLT